MSDESFSLSTTPEVLLPLGVTQALAESEKPMCGTYGDVFFVRAEEADRGGNTEAAKAWHLLAQLCRLSLQEGNPSEPFRPGRLLMPSDLDQVSADAVRQLGFTVGDPELRARLLDITWEKLRDPEAAREAVRSYVDSANRLFDPERWIDYVDRAERALRLARLVRDQALVNAVLAEIERRVLDLDGSDPSFMTSRLMELLHEFKKGDPDRMTQIAQRAAAMAIDKSDFVRARSHLENVRRWIRLAEDQEGERKARIEIADSYERQADVQGDELLRAYWLEKAHQAYRNISGMRAKTREVYERLRDAQQAATARVQQIRSGQIDISDAVKAARERVSGKPLHEALLAFATVTRPTNFEKETLTAQQLIERFPLQNLMGGVILTLWEA